MSKSKLKLSLFFAFGAPMIYETIWHFFVFPQGGADAMAVTAVSMFFTCALLYYVTLICKDQSK